MQRILSKFQLLLFLPLWLAYSSSTPVNANDINKASKSDKVAGIYYLADEAYSDEIVSFHELSVKLKDNLIKTFPDLRVNIYNLASKQPFEIDSQLKLNKDLAITIGKTTLLKILASRNDMPVFALHTPRVTLDRMTKIYADLGIQVSGIYREQPLTNQMALARVIEPDYNNIYLLLGRLSRYHLNSYQKQIENQSYILNYQILDNQNSPVSYLNKMRPFKGFLPLLDNPQQFKRRNIELLLPVSFHLNIPMIGSRQVHASIGALATVYSNQNELVLATNDIISKLFGSGEYKKPHYLENFSILINQQIAHNYNYKNLNEKELELELATLQKINQLKKNNKVY